MIPEGCVYEFFRRLAAKPNLNAVLKAVGNPDATIEEIKLCPDYGGLGRTFSEQAIKDGLFELSLSEPPILMALIQNTQGIMDTIAEYDAPDPGRGGGARPAYGVPFPRR